MYVRIVAPCMYNFPIQNRGSDFGGDAASLFLVLLLRVQKIFDILLFLLKDAIGGAESRSYTCWHLIVELQLFLTTNVT